MSTLFSATAARRGMKSGSEDGQGLVEYALILALIAVVAIVALTGFGQGIVTLLGQITSSL